MSVPELGYEMSLAWANVTIIWLCIALGLMIGFGLLGFGRKFDSFILKVVGGGVLFLCAVGLLGMAS